jgi:hypothetical protein
MTGLNAANTPPEPTGQVPSATRREVGVSSRVLVTNPVWNGGSGYVKRKIANFYVSEGRAEWIGEGQLRLVENHPKNRAAKFRAEQVYASLERRLTSAEKHYAATARSAARWGRNRKRSAPDLKHSKQRSAIVTRFQTKVQTLQEFSERMEQVQKISRKE